MDLKVINQPGSELTLWEWKSTPAGTREQLQVSDKYLCICRKLVYNVGMSFGEILLFRVQPHV